MHGFQTVVGLGHTGRMKEIMTLLDILGKNLPYPEAKVTGKTTKFPILQSTYETQLMDRGDHPGPIPQYLELRILLHSPW